jgi:PAS domain S-box-containing protein
MKKKEGLPIGAKEGRRRRSIGYLLPMVVVIIAFLVVGVIAVSTILVSPISIVVAGVLGACVIALGVYLALEWWHFREQNKGYIDEITDLNLRFGILADAVSAVSSTLDLEELVANIMGVMLTLTNSGIGVVLIPDDSLTSLQVLSHRGFQEKAVRALKIPVGKGAVGKAFQNGQMVIRKNLPEDPRAAETYSEGKSPRSQIIMPLKAKGQMVGIAVTATCEEHDYKPEEVALLSSLCHELAVAMINVDLYQQSQKTLEWLADMQEYTEHFIQEMLAGVVVINEAGDVIFFNREAADILDIEPKEVIGVNYNDLAEEIGKFSSLSFIKPIFRLCLEEGRAFRRHEMAVERPGGKRLSINFNAFPLHRAKGERMGAAMVFMDISAIKEMESRLRQQGHLSILGQMAAKIAHEVKNPLFAIIGLADELEEEESDPEHKHLLAMIKQEAILSNQWISGMLTFSKSPFPVGEEAALYLQSSIPELIADFLRTHDQDKMKVVRDFGENLPPVMMSRDNMRHILFNLLENSMQAMPDGGIITVRAHDTGNGFVEMRVEDTGAGIRPEVMQSVFEPFFTTKDGGTGLGLSIVQKILLDIGGDIDVRSQQDLGTTFILKLPTRGIGHERD